MNSDSQSRLSGYVPGRHILKAAMRVAGALEIRPQPLARFREALKHLPTDGLYAMNHLLDGEELLVLAGVATRTGSTIARHERWEGGQISLELLASCYLERHPPPWLGAATREVEVDCSLIPADEATTLAGLYGDPDRRDAVLLALGQKFDAEGSQRLGEEGEAHVVEACKQRLECAGAPELARQVLQVSRRSDSLGYDVRTPTLEGEVLRLEVKTGGSFAAAQHFYLSRNEFKTGAADPQWRLVLCARRYTGEIRIIGWCKADAIAPLVPLDQPYARWQTVRVTVPEDLLTPGLPPLEAETR